MGFAAVVLDADAAAVIPAGVSCSHSILVAYTQGLAGAMVYVMVCSYTPWRMTGPCPVLGGLSCSRQHAAAGLLVYISCEGLGRLLADYVIDYIV